MRLARNLTASARELTSTATDTPQTRETWLGKALDRKCLSELPHRRWWYASFVRLESTIDQWYYAVSCHACGRRIPFSSVEADIPTYAIEL